MLNSVLAGILGNNSDILEKLIKVDKLVLTDWNIFKLIKFFPQKFINESSVPRIGVEKLLWRTM